MQTPYEQFTAVEFVCDDAFLSHYLSPTQQSARFWEQWLHDHPHRRTEWEQAGWLLEAVQLGLRDYARTYLSEEAEDRLLARIRATNEQSALDATVIRFRPATWLKWAAAACLAVLVGTGVWLLTERTEVPSLYQQQVADLPVSRIERVNPSRQTQSFRLPDGSTVQLSPRSRLSYAADFGQATRIIYLLGEATFDVARNPEKPFYVHANELVTKVLGTRFVVKAYEQDRSVMVTVQHGRVSVYRNKPDREQALTGVLLTPNQQVVFTRQTEQFTKTIVSAPVLVQGEKSGKDLFVFDETPVAKVFERLEKAYGIDIIYNRDVLTGCQLTASLTDENLFQKLDAITQSIDATYELVDGQVVITAKGCQSR